MSERPGEHSGGTTPSQTVGPYLSIGLTWPDGPYVVPEDTPGAFWIRGRLLDGAGEPVPDGMVETWQCDPDGRFDHPDDARGAAAPSVPGFRGFSRCGTDAEGRWALLTVRPGRLPDGDGGLQAPHLDVSVFARGLLDRVVTRIYFDGDPGNADDPVLALAGPRAGALLARQTVDGTWRFDIHLRGDDESVFFVI